MRAQIHSYAVRNYCNNPANIRLDEDVFRLRLQKTSSRRLDQDEYIGVNHMSPEDVFKNTSSRRLQEVLVKTNIFVQVALLQDVFKTSSRSLQGVLKRPSRHLAKTSSKRLQDVLQKHLQDIFKAFSRHFEDFFKTSSIHLQNVCKDVFKTFSRSIIKLNCSC